MKLQPPARLFFMWCLVLMFAAGFSSRGEAQKFIPVKDEVSFEVRVLPDDPFDSKNELKADGKWKARRGEVVRVEVVGKLKDHYHTYPITQRTTEQVEKSTVWTPEKVKGVTPLWPIYESEPEVYTEKRIAPPPTGFRYSDTFSWAQSVLIDQNAPMGTIRLPINLQMQVCSVGCADLAHTVTAEIEVSDDPPMPMTPEINERLKLAAPPPVTVVPAEQVRPKDIVIAPKKDVVPVKGVAPVQHAGGAVPAEGLIRDSHEQYAAKMQKLLDQIQGKPEVKAGQDQASADLLGFVLTGMLWGAISLVTPCVFPMIPITVSFFLKQSEKDHHRPIVMAGVYSLTIVVVLTMAAAFLLAAFQKLSVHPLTNYFLGGLFIFFALSLFGMYEIELPQSLAQYTSSKEGKGGLVGTVFMALTFTIISFACVAPFLGGFGGTAAAARPLWHNILGGLAFSATFAAPFFFLALFPTLLRKMPKSGSWLNSVKVTMGFLEFAAAFKFFRSAELVQTAGSPSFFTFDLVLGLWIALCVLCGAYLIGMFRLPHDTPEEHISVPRLVFSMAFFGLALYLTPALFKMNANQTQRPGGTVYAWIDAFLLPDSRAGSAETANLDYAVNLSREELKRTGKAKRIFLDFTGVTCPNCRINEQNVLNRPDIVALLDEHIVVKLYTDAVPKDYYVPEARADANRFEKDADGVNRVFQNKLLDTLELPTYAVLEPQADNRISLVWSFKEGLIRDTAAFANLLRQPNKK